MIDIAMLLVPKEVFLLLQLRSIHTWSVCCSIATVACVCYIHFLPPKLFGVSCRFNLMGQLKSQGNLFRRLHLELFLNPPIFSDLRLHWGVGNLVPSVAPLPRSWCAKHTTRSLWMPMGTYWRKEQSGSLASTKTGDELPHVQQTKVGEHNFTMVYDIIILSNNLVGVKNQLMTWGVHIGRWYMSCVSYVSKHW